MKNKNTDNILAVIPARGGSKRIPKKNIIDFEGKPLIAWTIEAAIKSRSFAKVIVSTDDYEIAEIAKSYGAEVPFIRESCNDDITPISSATIAALDQSEHYWDTKFSTVVQLMANCPIRSSNTIREHIDQFYKENREFQISSFEFGWMNPWWALECNKGRPTPLFPKALKSRSQDLNKLYCPTGSIWIAKSEALRQHDTFYGPNYSLEIMSWEEAVDIDEWEDLKFARVVHKLRSEQKVK
jgi:CMP-N-acetylneuraminic acid synthetase